MPLLELDTRELEDPRYLRNDTDRCYFCKAELWTRLAEVARRQGFDTIIDGTNADDLGEHRPGLRAGREGGIRSPLAELGWSKEAVRTASRDAGPSHLGRTGRALSLQPGAIRSGHHARPAAAGGGRRGVPPRNRGSCGDLRVRHHGRHASVEVAPAEMPMLRARWEAVERFFTGLGFERVELDPSGYRRGRLLALAPHRPNLMRLFAALPIAEPARGEIAKLLARLREPGWPLRLVQDHGRASHDEVLR